ncbi:MAG: hypothetical protein OXT67_01430 [Zetaproteobacteria bacterium]|nr:hypothetical protein [Zetaproteobacteria bacterium]
MVTKEKRVKMRFPAEDFAIAYLDDNPEGEFFQACAQALIADESMEGAKLVFVHKPELEQGQVVKLKVGELPICKATVQWLRYLESDIFIAGFHYELPETMQKKSS